MDKKKHERTILGLVYAESQYAEVAEAERPDFHVQHKSGGSYFGVEVTELHASESYARLHHIPDYFEEIITHKRYRHKVDKTTLEPVEVEIKTSDGESKGKSPALFQEMPDTDEYVGMVVDVIKAKDSKFSDYSRDLNHINLIVYDAVHALVTLPVDHFFEYFYTSCLKDALYASNFREVFLVTILEKDRQVYVPLKMLLLLAEFHLFHMVFFDYPWETSDDEVGDTIDKGLPDSEFTILYAKYLRSKTDKVYIYEQNGVIEVVLGNCGIVLEPDTMRVHDYADYPIPPGVRPVEVDEWSRLFATDEFRTKEQEVLAGSAFRTELAFDVESEF